MGKGTEDGADRGLGIWILHVLCIVDLTTGMRYSSVISMSQFWLCGGLLFESGPALGMEDPTKILMFIVVLPAVRD